MARDLEVFVTYTSNPKKEVSNLNVWEANRPHENDMLML